jgi:hypothetical protein
MNADQLRFEEHLKSPEYVFGEIQGYWGQVSELENGPSWPFSLFWIEVFPKGERQVTRYYVWVELSNYNLLAPAGFFYDPETKRRLANHLWPKVTGPFERGFRIDWNPQTEMYAPWDRGGYNAHQEWVQQNAAVSFKSGVSSIADYLRILHEILNSDHYHGTNA